MSASGPHVVGYNFKSFNGREYQSLFWGLNENLCISSPFKFFKGDSVLIDSVSAGGVHILPCADLAPPEKALLFVSTPMPLSAKHDFTLYANGCEILVRKEALSKGNKIFLMLVSVPVEGKSTIHGLNEKRERFIFSFQAAAN